MADKTLSTALRLASTGRRTSLRARLTIFGTLALALGLLIGAFLLIYVLEYTLGRNIDKGAEKTARDVAVLISSGNVPQPVPAGGSGTVIQVIDNDNTVRAASSGADHLVSMLHPDELRLVRAGHKLTLAGSRIADNGRWRVVAAPGGLANDPLTVVVAVPAVESAKSVHVVKYSLLVTFPLLLAASAGVTWFVLGRALRPVEGMRLAAAVISEAGSGTRLPVPRGHDEVHRLAVTLNDMLERIADAHRRQRQFVADVAHELRTPLTSLRAQLEIAERTGDRQVAADVLLDADRLAALVDDLLLLARADEGQIVARAEPVAVAVVAAAVGRDLPQVTACVAADIAALVDERHLHRILTNLVSNAVRHAAERVEITARLAGDWVEIDVVDDGPGIAPEDRDRVLQRFVRLDDARARDEGGSGLGLAIVTELVRAAGGRFSLRHADPGGRRSGNPGLRVQMLLPRA